MARGTSRVVAAVVLVAAAVLASRAGRADPPAAAGTEREFLAALEKARAALAAGDAAGGKRLLDDALERHARRDYARAKRRDVEDLAKRLAFRADCPPPDPATLVKGTLTKYVSKTGEIEIRYRGEPTDFVAAKDGDLVFPARFCGPFSIAARGSSYPKTTEASPTIQVGMEADPKTGREQTWLVVPGIPQYDAGSKYVWLPARLVHYDGEDEKVVYEKETSLAKPGEPWRLEVRVTKTRITATIDGKPLGSGPKPDTVFGHARLDVPGWSEIVVAGQVEPSWIQSKIDAVVDGKRAAFEAKFESRDHLPKWLYEAPAPAEAEAEAEADEPAESDAPAGLEDLDPALRSDVEEFAAHLARHEHREALEVVDRLREEGAGDAVTGLLAAMAHTAAGETEKALAAADRALAAAPDLLPVLELRASLLLRAGRDAEAAAAWKTLASKPGANADLLARACLSLLYAGRHDDARAVSEGAAARGVDSPILAAVGRVLVQAARGPTWPKTYEHKSANYHVMSDIDVETCKRAAEILEESLTVYRIHVRPLKAAAKRLYRVYLFGGQAGFLRYHEDVTLLQGRKPEHAAGLYSPLLKQLLIWNLPNRDEMMRTVRHEGFHQYLDRLMPDPPVWFNEGMAVYYEGMEKVAGEMRSGLPRPDDLEVLAEGPLVPLEKFLEMEPPEFYAGSHRSYAQAWLLVHMLRHGTPKQRDLYKAFVLRLETATGAEATRAVFDEATIRALDADLAAYRDALSKRDR